MKNSKETIRVLNANEYVFSFIEKFQNMFPKLNLVKGFDVRNTAFDDNDNVIAIQFELEIEPGIINLSIMKRLQEELDIILIAVSDRKITFRSLCA